MHHVLTLQVFCNCSCLQLYTTPSVVIFVICFSLKGSVGCLISLFSYLSLSSRIEPLGTPLCPHLVWLRQCWRSSSCCILSVTSPLSVAWVTCSMAKSNIAKAALFTQDIVELGHLPENMLRCFITFYDSWKGWALTHKKLTQRKAAFYLQLGVFAPWLICWTATWWCLLSLASTVCVSLRDSLPGRMTQPWQR